MPLYPFVHVDTGEVHDVFHHMDDEKTYAGPDGNEKGKWKRTWYKPLASIDTRCDPHSAKDFVKVTNRAGDVGSLWDRSREMSIKRKEKDGIDSVKEHYYQDYSAKRHGKKHPEQQREENVKAFDKVGIKVDYGED